MSSLFPGMASSDKLATVDETGLDEIYTWVRDQPPATADISYQEAVQGSFKAMIEDAGLRLETRKVPKETIVVDRLEKKPTEN